MKKIQYLEILKKAFFLSWKNKFLWFFGFFIFLSLVIGSIDLKKKYFSESAIHFQGFSDDNVYLLAVVLLLVLAVCLAVLKILSLAGLIASINNPVLYKQKKIRETLTGMSNYFWRLLGLEFLIDFNILAIGFVLLLPVVYLFSLKAFLFGILISILAIVIFVPLFILAFLLKKFGSIFLVLNDSKLMIALEFSYGIFLKHIKESLWMFLAMLGLGVCFLGSLMAMIVLVMLVFSPFFLISYFILAKMFMMVLLFLFSVVLLCSSFVLSAFFIVYAQTAWQIFFSEIAMQKIEENVEKQMELVEDEIPNPEVA